MSKVNVMPVKKFLLSSFSVFGLLVLSATSVAAETFSAKVVSVPDGDSLNVVRAPGGMSEKVILYGIDCPEMGQEFGQEARAFTDGACYKKEVKIEETGKDSRGRIVANIYLSDGTNLNQQLVEKGLAWWSDKYAPNDKALKDLFSEAKAKKVGLWSSATKPIPPWLFRNGEKNVGAQIRPKD